VRDVVGLGGVWPDPWTVPLLTVQAAGELLGMSRSAAYRAARRGDIPTRTLGGLWVPTAELMAQVGLPVPPARASRPRIVG
jgi:hypothetical protein